MPGRPKKLIDWPSSRPWTIEKRLKMKKRELLQKRRGRSLLEAWFNTNRTVDHDHNHIDTREELKAYDAGAYQFLEKIFKDEP